MQIIFKSQRLILVKYVQSNLETDHGVTITRHNCTKLLKQQLNYRYRPVRSLGLHVNIWKNNSLKQDNVREFAIVLSQDKVIRRIYFQSADVSKYSWALAGK